MKTIFTVACLAACATAYISKGKAEYLKMHGVNMSGLYERHEKLLGKQANKRLTVQRQAKQLRTAFEEREAHKLKQQYDNYGNEIYFDDYGNEIKREPSQESVYDDS